MTVRRTYVRPMEGWWKKNPFFLRYMAREATAIFVYLYALVLTWGLVALANGEAAFEDYLATLASPAGMTFQLVCLAVFAYHTWSWFVIMPKTMPPVVVGGRRMPGAAITSIGVGAAIVASLAIYALAVAS
jgi:fumarate reductase subunit C